MPDLLCLTCGSPAAAADSACAECGTADAAPVATPAPGDPDERLLDRIADTLRLSEERRAAAGEADRALRMRLEGQASVLRARLRSRALPVDEGQMAYLAYALARVERALADLSSR